MAFWICAADSAGNRISGAEEKLSPGPAELDYPQDSAGTALETGSGRIIKQQPLYDPRKRAWLWHSLPTGTPTFERYDRLIQRLESLLSRTRREQGLSPYVYLKDEESDAFRLWKYYNGTATSVSGSTLTDNTKNWGANALKNGVVEIKSGTGAGQRRSILSNTATALTITPAWTVNPASASYTVQASVNDWIRVRVLKVTKRTQGRGTVMQDIRLEFVVEDPNWNGWD